MAANSNLISVIVPTYNSARFLDEAVESAVGQTYKNLEVLIIDDGSTDGTEALVKKWQNKSTGIHYIKHEKNKGLPAARNTGIRYAKGKYIALLDADDTWLPRKLDVQLHKLEELGVDVLFSNWFIWQGEKKQIAFDFKQERVFSKEKGLCAYIRKNYGVPSTAFIKRSALEKVGLFDESLKSSEDYDLWLRFLLKGFKIGLLREPLAYYRLHSTQMSTNFYRMHATRLTIFKNIVRQHPMVLLNCPIIWKKIFLHQGYKIIQDFINLFS